MKCKQEYIKKVELDLQNFGEFSTWIRIRISNLEVKRLEDIYAVWHSALSNFNCIVHYTNGKTVQLMCLRLVVQRLKSTTNVHLKYFFLCFCPKKC